MLGDVDLDSAVERLLWINGHGTFGDITIQGKPTTGLVPGLPTGTTTVQLPGSDVVLRILSPFTDKTFVPTPPMDSAWSTPTILMASPAHSTVATG